MKPIQCFSLGFKLLRIALLLLLLLALPFAGQTQDYSYITNNGAITLTGYAGPGGALTIPSVIGDLPVASIGDAVFQGHTDLTSVTIPNSITNFGSAAFAATGLTEVRIPEKVSSIWDSAFADCANLTSVTIPTNAVSLGFDVFARSGQTDPSTGLTVLTVNGSIMITASDCLGGEVVIPGVIAGRPVTSIGDSTFQGCTGLNSVTIPDGVTQIGHSTFQGCSGLGSVTIPNSVTNVGNSAFQGCMSVTNVTLGDHLGTIGGRAFSSTSLRTIFIPDSVTSIGEEAFYYTGLTNVSIGKGVIRIGVGAFAQSALRSVTIPNNVLSIEGFAFYNCFSLTNVAIGQGVTNIGDEVFDGCMNLTAIKVDASNSSYVSVDGVLFDKLETTLIRCPPAGKGGHYTIPSSVTNIASHAFNGCTRLSGVSMPNAVLSIADFAFTDCTALTAITIPDRITSIGNSAFSGCTRLANITFPNTVTNIGDGALSGCNGLATVTLPDSLAKIPDSAFTSCANLKSVTVGNQVTNIGGFAFYHCTKLTGVYFRGNAPDLGDSVFVNANRPTVYYLPGTTGWDSTFDNLRTKAWLLPNPVVLTTGSNFGLQNNTFGFTISWATNIPVVVEGSADLAHSVWTPVATNALTDGWSYFSDPQWTNYPTRFYRLRSQ